MGCAWLFDFLMLASIAFLAVALPPIGAEESSLSSAGFRLWESGCGTKSKWEAEHEAKLYVSGWSSIEHGDVVVVIHTADGAVDEMFMIAEAGQLEPWQRQTDQCVDVATAINELGVDIETRRCSSSLIVERRVRCDERPLATCGELQWLRDVWLRYEIPVGSRLR